MRVVLFALSPYLEFRRSTAAIPELSYMYDSQVRKTNIAVTEIDLTLSGSQMGGMWDHKEKKPDAV